MPTPFLKTCSKINRTYHYYFHMWPFGVHLNTTTLTLILNHFPTTFFKFRTFWHCLNRTDFDWTFGNSLVCLWAIWIFAKYGLRITELIFITCYQNGCSDLDTGLTRERATSPLPHIHLNFFLLCWRWNPGPCIW